MRLRVIGLIVIVGLAILAASLVAEAQPTGKVYRLGQLTEGVRPMSPSFIEALRVLGYVEGHNLFFEQRHAESREQLPALAAELVTLKVDLIVTFGTPAARAAQQATTTIPIFFILSGDPVQSGLVASFMQPGGNLTGIAAGLYNDKQLAILKEAVPSMVRVACLCPRDLEPPIRSQIMDTARRLHLELLDIAVSGPDDFDRFFAEARRTGADAVFVHDVAWFHPYLTRLGELAAQSRLPAIGHNRLFVEAGGLLAYGRMGEYGPRLAATYVDKLLQGAKPGDLPVDQLMHFALVINLKTAKALGLTIPPMLLFQADEVIR